jgi:hypothetical protein
MTPTTAAVIPASAPPSGLLSRIFFDERSTKPDPQEARDKGGPVGQQPSEGANPVGRATPHQNEHLAVGIERGRSAHVDNQRRRRAVEQTEKITGDIEAKPSMPCALLAWAKLAQRLDGQPSDGVPALPRGLI